MNNVQASSKNLVLGVVKGYSLEQIKPFLLSLKQSGYEGDICLFTSEISPETCDSLQQFGEQYGGLKLCPFQVISGINFPYKVKDGHFVFKKLYPYLALNIYPLNRIHLMFVNTMAEILKKLTNKNEYIIKANMAKTYLSITEIRHFLYYLYLSEHGKDYSKILITDVRDVLFQRDPFEFDFSDKLCAFLEGVTIKSCSYTSTWIRNVFGSQALNEIGDNKLLCAGTTLGTRSAIMSYLETMIDYVLRSKSQKFGIDQAIHNYIIHKGLIEGVRFYDNYQGPVLTMTYSKEENLCFDNHGFLINSDGSIINILHQYDRKDADLKRKMIVYRNSECTN